MGSWLSRSTTDSTEPEVQVSTPLQRAQEGQVDARPQVLYRSERYEQAVEYEALVLLESTSDCDRLDAFIEANIEQCRLQASEENFDLEESYQVSLYYSYRSFW